MIPRDVQPVISVDEALAFVRAERKKWYDLLSEADPPTNYSWCEGRIAQCDTFIAWLEKEGKNVD